MNEALTFLRRPFSTEWLLVGIVPAADKLPKPSHISDVLTFINLQSEDCLLVVLKLIERSSRVFVNLLPDFAIAAKAAVGVASLAFGLGNNRRMLRMRHGRSS